MRHAARALLLLLAVSVLPLAAASAEPLSDGLQRCAREMDEHLRLDAKIAGLRQGSHGEYTFTLDNGQVWVEQEFRPGERFSVGEAVQIKHGFLGSLWLSASDHRMTRVKRIS